MPDEIAEGVDIRTPAHRLRDTAEGRRILLASGRNVSTARVERKRTKANAKDRERPAPSHKSKWETRQFVAWDGEGVDVAGRHHYVILANSLGDVLVDRNGIKTEAAFEMMFRAAAKAPKAVHVIFAGGYDVNMILRGALKRWHAHMLADRGYVDVKIGTNRYRIRYLPRHEFGVTRIEWKEGEDKPKRYESFTWWDIFGSFQCSFVSACSKLLTAEDLTELDHITDMKGKRGNFRTGDIPEMVAYCQAELRALVRLAEVDRDNFESAGFRATRWDGAGAKASAVLKAREVQDHKAETPPEIMTAVRGAYAGGRIEGYRFGYYNGPVFTVDLRSAYPWAATFLPSLADGTWQYIEGGGPEHGDEFSVWHVSYQPSDIRGLHPLFWRSDRGDIAYPVVTSGWYWAPEVYEAQRAHGAAVRVDSGWRFTPATDTKPFAFIPDLFRIRAALERSRKGQGVALKFALNSLYGKLAQQVGAKDGKPPRWHQLEWAGWITSKTRATVYNIARQRQDNLVDIATDGVCFFGAEPDSELLAREGTGLGDLEVARYDAGVWVQSGVYWLHDPDKGWIEPKVRGVGAPTPCKTCAAGAEVSCPHRRPLARQRFLDLWGTGSFDRVQVDVTRFRGLVTSAITDERWSDWGQWITETRDIAGEGRGKRVHYRVECDYCSSRQGTGGSLIDGTGLHSTMAVGGGTESCLHSLSWAPTIDTATTNEWWRDTLDTEDTETE